MSHEQHAASENDRQLANVFRLGSVSAVDAANALVKVESGGVTTDWIPWAVSRAGGERVWSCPSVGEQVVMGAPFGDLSQAVVLGMLYQDAHAQPSTSPNKARTEYPDGSFIEYDSGAHHYTINVSGGAGVTIICQQATIQAAGSVTVETPEASFSGNVTIAGATVIRGGLAVSGGTGATVAGAMAVTGGDVTADGKSLKTHTHGGVGPGSSTTSPPL